MAFLALAVSGCVSPQPHVSLDEVSYYEGSAPSAPQTTAKGPLTRFPTDGCFGGQLGFEPWGHAAAASTVVVRMSDQPRPMQATGTVVADSGDAASRHNRIITARHVIQPALDDGRMVPIYSSGGQQLGWADVVAVGTPGNSVVEGGYSIPRGDTAVLVMRGFMSGQDKVYDAIPGIPLSPSQPLATMTGTIGNPGGIDGGASGSSVLDSEGRIVSIMDRRSDDASRDGTWAVKARVEGGDPEFGMDANGHVLKKIVMLPSTSVAFSETLADPPILAALGAAAFGVHADPSYASSPSSVEIFSIPSDTCIVYRGVMTQAHTRLF